MLKHGRALHAGEPDRLLEYPPRLVVAPGSREGSPVLRREPRPQHEVPRVTELCRVPCGSDPFVMAAVERRETRTNNGDEGIRQPVVLGAERVRLVEDRLRLLTTAELEQGERGAPRGSSESRVLRALRGRPN